MIFIPLCLKFVQMYEVLHNYHKINEAFFQESAEIMYL